MDSQSYFDSLTTQNTTTEKRFLIDLRVLREPYQKRDIADVYWIPGDQNPVDAVTKKGVCDTMENLLAGSNISITRSSWIERNTPSWANSIPEAIAKTAHVPKSECCSNFT